MMAPNHKGLRPFQSELEKTLYERLLSGAAITVAWIAPGSGKTTGYYHAHQRLFIEKLIRFLVIFVPRLTLKRQAEQDWMGLKECYLPPVMGKIVAVNNETPLTRPDEFGYISTYSALVANPRLHLDWAKAHAGEFALICDEAQFLGADDTDTDSSSGTQAAALIEQVAKYARHSLLTTGTTARSDGSPLVLAEYSDRDTKGWRTLQYHVKATYREGVTLRYLRPAAFSLTNGNITFSDLETEEISNLERRLHKLLREPAVWQNLCQKIVDQLLECRRAWSRYRAVISCIDQQHARDVARYLTKQYPGMRIRLAISDAGKEAQDVLLAFCPKEKEYGGQDDGDILVTVGMVSIGYNCPTITVVGNLSSRRWRGWLEQFFGRGSRMWTKGGTTIDEQICYYISTNDPKNRRFAERMRKDSEAGIKDRPPIPPLPPSGSPDVSIINVKMTDEEMLGLSPDQDLSPAELAGIRKIKLSSGRYVPETLIAEIFRAAGHAIPTATTMGASANTKTDSETRKDDKNKIMGMLARYVHNAYNLATNSEEFQIKISRLGAHLNKMQNVKSLNDCTEEQRHERIRILDEWIVTGVPR